MIIRETKVTRKCKLKGEKCQMSISHDDLADMANSSKAFVRETVASKLRLLPEETFAEGEFDEQVDEFVSYLFKEVQLVAKEKLIMTRFAEEVTRQIAALSKDK